MDERENPQHAKDVLMYFNEMKENQAYCDFTLKIGDEEIPVHRHILAASSKYFDAMFKHKMRESETAFAEILGIEPSAGKQCLEYIYTGKAKFSRKNPKDLIHAAELMQLHGLMDLYFMYLVEDISPENCLQYMELAVTYNKPSFSKVFEKFLGENFEKVVKTKDFVMMDQTLLQQCLDSLPSEKWDSEKLKWEALISWVNSDAENRRDYFSDLFKLIDLERLPKEFLREKLTMHSLILQSDVCKLRVFDAFFRERQVKDTKPPELIYYNKESGIMHRYDLVAEKWHRHGRVSLPKGRYGSVSNCVAWEGNFYKGTSSALMASSDCGKTWKNLFSTSTNTSNSSCLCVCDPYVIMVMDNGAMLRYNTDLGAGQRYLSNSGMSYPYTSAASCAFIYVMELHKQNRIQEFTFEGGSWGLISPPNYARIDGAIAFYQGKLIAFGGYHIWNQKGSIKRNNTTIEYYLPGEDRWIVLPRCKQNFYSGLNPTALVVDGELFVIEKNGKPVVKLDLTGFAI